MLILFLVIGKYIINSNRKLKKKLNKTTLKIINFQNIFKELIIGNKNALWNNKIFRLQLLTNSIYIRYTEILRGKNIKSSRLSKLP